MRWKDDDRLIIISNFDAVDSFGFELQLPGEIIRTWNLYDSEYTLQDQLSEATLSLIISEDKAETRIDLKPLQSLILKLQ